jgi:NAD(P)-dependent dehydrogenase (short-subunit alcohol dehydrogenase family)
MTGLRALPGQSHYSASKHGVVGITNSLALELGEFGIRVNSIHPYAVDTAMVQPELMETFFVKHPSYLYALNPMPLKAIGDEDEDEGVMGLMAPEEISDIVAWLAGDGSALITGSQIAVDRGVMKY